ncbi:serine O-acetyltransferase EpsC [Streptomyces sp. ST2-7A]|uniref:serine O-acetyltransferase EpsC n=1 Tax=Streptomyces sp. ST2-7A TaxID=2907214 RepID=UPI001F36AFC7|nr:serine O-acetyltransferase EpsC [Streptomyces sp. ST2-7A]MCE7079529.1 serine O-acetyltransferase [Streptomyces sp. ST2-7A]
MSGGDVTPRGGLFGLLREDLGVVVERDPSVRSAWEAVWHPALLAVWSHRIAHPLHRAGRRTLARWIAMRARRRSGVEIHPGAVLGRRVFIDHGAAVVIGETARVGDDVTIYQQVTLGAVGWWTDNSRAAGARRHPVVGSGAVLGTNVTVLGPVTVGEGAMVGAMAIVMCDVPPAARIKAGSVVSRSSKAVRDDLRAVASAGCW